MSTIDDSQNNNGLIIALTFFIITTTILLIFIITTKGVDHDENYRNEYKSAQSGGNSLCASKLMQYVTVTKVNNAWVAYCFTTSPPKTYALTI